MELEIRWLGRIPYREAWDLQHDLVRQRAAGEIGDLLLVLEHDAVLTLGRQADPSHVRATSEELERRGIELIRVERGGEVTYHGPGQLVGYPIVSLTEHHIMVRSFVRALEAALSRTAAAYSVVAGRREGFPGSWVDPDGARPRKLAALGLRVERGVTYHGIAMNVTTDLEDFALIDPCGLTDAEVTSIGRERGWRGDEARPSTASVGAAATIFGAALNDELSALDRRVIAVPASMAVQT